MREINKIFCSSLFFILLTFSVKAENKVLIMGSADAKINVKVFSSLTCPHCANFHKDIYPLLKKEYLDTGLAKIEFRHFPLDVAA